MIGKIIRKLRIEKNITQNELSNFLGLTPKMISFYELGERFPPYDIILKISDYFNVSTDYLLGKTQNYNNFEIDKIMADYYSLSEKSKKDFETFIELLKIKDAKDKNKI